MIKHLLLIPLFIMLVGCIEETEKIRDGSGDVGNCPNGNCPTKPSSKPAACVGAQKFKTFVGETFQTEEIKRDGVGYQTQIIFANANLSYTQFCRKGTDILSPGVLIDYDYSPTGQISFNTTDAKEKTKGDFVCRASTIPEVFNFKFEGNCLVLTSASGKNKTPIYYLRQ